MNNNTKLLSVQKPVATADQVHQILRHALLQQQFRPGEKLVETRLAADMNVSRTPIREALLKLEAEGLVDTAPNGGVIVRDIDAEYAEIYAIRQRLESLAASLAAVRRTDEQIAELERILDAIDALGVGPDNVDERVELNNQFHMLLTEASHSPRLVRLVSDYRDYFLNRQFALFYDVESNNWQRRQHREIIEALRNRDSEAAERIVFDHFQRASEVIQRGLSKQES